MDETPFDVFVATLNEHPEGVSRLFQRAGYLPFLPLLQSDYQAVQRRLGQALLTWSLDALSLRELAHFALTKSTPFWQGKAMDWIDSGLPLDLELAHAVREADRQELWPYWTQKMRHQRNRILERWRVDPSSS